MSATAATAAAAAAAPPKRLSTELSFTPVGEVAPAVARARRAFASGATRPAEWRRAQLRRLHAMVDENRELISAATYTDLRKPRAETFGMELLMVLNEAAEAIDHLDAWMAPRRPAVGMLNRADDVRVVREPLGVVLIMGAWNYPFQLTLAPLIGALAAGNTVVLKPSELSPASARVIGELCARYLDRNAVVVVQGGVAESTALLAERFDHIVYTGNGAVGRIVMAAAARHLTPVTLELGGKSPALLDTRAAARVDIGVAARRLAWGRWTNAGQTCIAPDYVLCTRDAVAPLLDGLRAAVAEFYGADPQRSASYGRIVNARHFKRVTALLAATRGRVERLPAAGVTAADEADLYVAPHVIVEPAADDALMRDEIFGPLLPIVVVRDMGEAIAFVTARDKPLALYLFSHDAAMVERVTRETSAGGMVVNDTLMHAGCMQLPFGGVGESGTGAYHGEYSFERLSHHKAYLGKKLGMERVNGIRYPPYSERQRSWLEWLALKRPGGAARAARIKVGLALLAVALSIAAVYYRQQQ